MRSRRRLRSTSSASWEEENGNDDDVRGGGREEAGDHHHRRRRNPSVSDEDDHEQLRSHRQHPVEAGEAEASNHHRDVAQGGGGGRLPSSPPPRPLRVSIPWQSFFSPTAESHAPRQHSRIHGGDSSSDYDDDPNHLREGEEGVEDDDGTEDEEGYHHDEVYASDDDNDCYYSGDDMDHHRALSSRTTSGLHHRRGGRTGGTSRHHRRNEDSDTPVPMPPTSPYRFFNASPTQQQHQHPRGRHPSIFLRGSPVRPSPSKSKSKRRCWYTPFLHWAPRWRKGAPAFLGGGGTRRGVKSAMLAAALLYLALVVHVYRKIAVAQQDANHAWMLSYELEKRRMARSYLEQKRERRMGETREAADRRAVRRRLLTQPKQQQYRLNEVSLEEEKALFSYDIVRVDPVGQSSSSDPDVQEDADRSSSATTLASMEELCGFYAQNASLARPELFPQRSSLANSKARVLITGILGPLGANLALTLKERCGVRRIVGIDPFYPNTVSSRLKALSVLEMLHHRLGDVLERPIVAAPVALEPRAGSINEKETAYLSAFADSTTMAQPWLDLVETFRPTHVVHLASYSPELREPRDKAALYSLRSSWIAMEHVLQSVASAPESKRPVLVHVTTSAAPEQVQRSNFVALNPANLLSGSARLMDEVLAETYHREYGVYSLAIRIPNAVFGPWGHVESPTYQILDQLVKCISPDADRKSPADCDAEVHRNERLDLVYAGDVVEGLVAAMQFRPPESRPLAMEFSSLLSLPSKTFCEISKSLLVGSQDPKRERVPPGSSIQASENRAHFLTHHYLGWGPSTPLRDGLVRTLAWHVDRTHPFGLRSPLNASSTQLDAPPSGDSLLERQSLSACAPNDLVCHGGSQYYPCASECSAHSQCTPSIFDGIIPLVREVLEGCDAVMYTQALGSTDELTLETEYMDVGNPLVCTVAFVSFDSPFVQSVVKKVPDSELAKLGVAPRHEDGGTPDSIHKLKQRKLNGRLLYLGWLLVWPDDTTRSTSHSDLSLLKLAPGRLFPSEVKHSVFIEQGFGASPRSDDAVFLIDSMSRPAVPMKVIKNKNPPKAKYLFPPEPSKRAVLLLSELRRQESPKSRDHSTDKLSVKQASRYMRYEAGEHPLGRESIEIKKQRDFYERAMSLVNSNFMRSPAEPLHKLEFRQLARTRWVVHDMKAEEGRQLRCEWLREHLQWNGSPLDQLSLAYVMAKRELERRVAYHEPDDRARLRIADQIEMKTHLTDVFEWHALMTRENRHYTPYAEVRSVPYSLTSFEDLARRDDNSGAEEGFGHGANHLFARIISDRTLFAARKDWNHARKKVLERKK